MKFTNEQRERLRKLFEPDRKVSFDTLPSSDGLEACYVRHKDENNRHSRIFFSVSGYFGVTMKCDLYTVKEARQAMSEFAEDISFAKLANDIIGYREDD